MFVKRFFQSFQKRQQEGKRKKKKKIQEIAKLFASHANAKTNLELEIEHETELYNSVLLCNKYCVP